MQFGVLFDADAAKWKAESNSIKFQNISPQFVQKKKSIKMIDFPTVILSD